MLGSVRLGGQLHASRRLAALVRAVVASDHGSLVSHRTRVRAGFVFALSQRQGIAFRVGGAECCGVASSFVGSAVFPLHALLTSWLTTW